MQLLMPPRVVAFGAPHAINVERLVHAEKDAFAPVWAALAAAQPIPCAVTGALHPPLAPPAVAVVSVRPSSPLALPRAPTPRRACSSRSLM